MTIKRRTIWIILAAIAVAEIGLTVALWGLV